MHVSSNNLLTHLKSDSFIEIDPDMDELDLTSAEAKATYQEIRQYIHDKYEDKIPNLYISQTKRKFGMEVGSNYNLSKKDSQDVPQYPSEKELIIIDAVKFFRMVYMVFFLTRVFPRNRISDERKTT